MRRWPAGERRERVEGWVQRWRSLGDGVWSPAQRAAADTLRLGWTSCPCRSTHTSRRPECDVRPPGPLDALESWRPHGDTGLRRADWSTGGTSVRQQDWLPIRLQEHEQGKPIIFFTCHAHTQFSQSVDVNWHSFGKGENKSQLIDIDSQPHQTMFQYTDSTL